MSAIRWIGAVLLIAVVVGTAFGPPPPAPRKEDPEVKKLLTQRRDVLRKIVTAYWQLCEVGRCTPEQIIGAMRKRMEIELELADTQANRIAVLEDILRLAAKVDTIFQARVEDGRAPIVSVMETRDFRLECEIALRRAHGKRPNDVPAAVEIKFGMIAPPANVNPPPLNGKK